MTTWELVDPEDPRFKLSPEEEAELNALFDLMSWASRKADEVWVWTAS